MSPHANPIIPRGPPPIHWLTRPYPAEPIAEKSVLAAIAVPLRSGPAPVTASRWKGICDGTM